MRRPVIAANWKMHKTIAQALQFVKEFLPLVEGVENRDVVLIPPFTALQSLAEALKTTSIKLGAQNLFWEKEGAFTGEIASSMVVDAGCAYVVIGHSERRQYFQETYPLINKKVQAALTAGLIPIMCIGETLSEREKGKTFEVIKNQITEGLKGLQINKSEQLVIAYEPIWAIGTGHTATPEQAEEVHGFIRELIRRACGKGIANGLRIQYGGSVKPENMAELMAMPDIDGALVGGASLKPDSFARIVKYDQ